MFCCGALSVRSNLNYQSKYVVLDGLTCRAYLSMIGILSVLVGLNKSGFYHHVDHHHIIIP